MDARDPGTSLETLWRMESPRLIARLTRMTGDLDSAEELAQDVLVTALERWPREGMPDNPAAWLATAAKHRAIDLLRRRALQAQRADQYAVELELQGAHVTHDEAASQADDDIGDDLLRLVFVACHPVLPLESRVALTLRLLGGLTTTEIARAFLQPEPTVAQRIVRAKRTLAEKRVPFEVPPRQDWPERLDAVLEVIYLVFNEGYSASAGEDWMRPALCEDALRLGRVLARLMPRTPDVHGLLALMELQASRASARTASDGTPVLLDAQDRTRWDRLQIARGLAALARAQALGDAPHPYVLQAEIAACHARATHATDTDWPRIAALYGTLARVAPSPVVELNRAVAVSRADGATAALPLLDALFASPALRGYGMLHAVHGDLLARVGRYDDARAAFEQAAALAGNARDRALMHERAERCVQARG